MNTRLLPLIALIAQLASAPAQAQGFYQEYPFLSWALGRGQKIYPHPDGSLTLTAVAYPDFGLNIAYYWLQSNANGELLAGDTLQQPINPGYAFVLLENGDLVNAIYDSQGKIRVSRTRSDGADLWTVFVNTPGYNFSTTNGIALAPDGTIVVSAEVGNVSGMVQANCLFKLSGTGDLIWQKYFSNGTYKTQYDDWVLFPTPDNGCLVACRDSVGANSTTKKVSRFDGAGNQLWTYAPVQGEMYFGKNIFVNAAGETFLTVKKTFPGILTDSIYLQRLSPTGILQQETNLPALSDPGHLGAELLFPTSDGGAIAILAGSYSLPSPWGNHVFRVEPDGSIGWYKLLSFLSDAVPASFDDGLELPDGNLMLYGYQNDHLFLIKMSAGGVIYPHAVTGTIARDSTFNCAMDSFDPPFQGWVVSASGNGRTSYAVSDAAGRYTLSDIDSGAYQVVLAPPSYLWQICDDTVQVQFSGPFPQTDTVDFQVQAQYDCPLMQVDIGTPFLRRCFPNTYAVHYCNAGNQPAPDASVTVTLDPLMAADSASIPYTQSGQVLTFDLGAVQAGECSTFYVYTTLSCDAQLGQTLCAEAHITPDTICAPALPNWSGAQVEVSAFCEGDSVRFQIKNTGQSDMPEGLDFIIIDDHVITRQGAFQLPAGDIHEEFVVADGSTWRMIAQQEPGFPFGAQMPAIGVEACVSIPGGGYTMGMLNMFPNFSGNPFDDEDCHTVIGSFDPNDKQAYPVGVDVPHFIEQNQPIEYLIRFQNTGTDTAFTVVLRDTLSPLVDPATIRPGAASHPYSWTLGGEGILTVVFDNILLPDSNTNALASNGFVQFRIDQQRDNPLGSVIENRAGIFFDFNAPVLTNTVFHTVGKNFLSSATLQPNRQLPRLAVWPNPADGPVQVGLGALYRPGRQLVLRDVLGRERRNIPVTSPVMELQRAGLAAGLYWLELRQNQALVATGKVFWVK